MRSFSSLLFALFLFCSIPAFSQSAAKPFKKVKLYARSVPYNYHISIQLPEDYRYSKQKKYPVVYLLDGNFYFEVVAAALRNYAIVGMTQSAILVGVGYDDLMVMDSLRNRDYTFPTALPEYEMPVSGGAEQFLGFLSKELSPYLQSKYRVNEQQQILMGHSLGGYFTLYALQQMLSTGKSTFQGFIAASPSTDYNQNYILDALTGLKEKATTKPKIYLSFGGLEDEENAEDAVPTLSSDAVLKRLDICLKDKAEVKTDIYSQLGHMDAAIPAFLKGLQWLLPPDE